MDRGSKFLSDLVLSRTYAATKPNGFKETWEEVIDRVLTQHCEKFPELADEILQKCRQPLVNKQVVPSMRSLQFGGTGIARENMRSFNCAFLNITEFFNFSEVFYVLMCGTGVGYSVQSRHVEQLPPITEGHAEEVMILDSREGWSDSVRKLAENPQCSFDYSLIRPSGAPLSTGGTASGPGALQKLHEEMRKLLQGAVGRNLSPIEVHDIVCLIADGVVVGGVRRAALLALFDWWDEEMLAAKSGAWWETAPWRGRANNSAVINRGELWAKEGFDKVMDACYASNSGEPGLYWTNNNDWGSNPCVEIALRSRQLCNLTEVNLSACGTKAEVESAVLAATILGTLQASYTDFHYVSPEWKQNCDREALLGVSLTGQAEAWEIISDDNYLTSMSSIASSVNREWAEKLGINPAARITCTKPSGSASAFLGSTSGIHAAHAPFYIRRVRIDVTHPVAKHLQTTLPAEFMELDQFNPSNFVVSIPVAKEGAIMRDAENPIALLERMKHINRNWIRPCHSSGDNTHNVSLTVSYKKPEEEEVSAWMWENRDIYAGISLLPFDGGTYVQAPFEEITKERYEEMLSRFPEVDLVQVNYLGKIDDRQSEAACAGGQCTWGL